MAWKKGQCGNPGGRPKSDPAVLAALKSATPKAVEVLIELLDSKNEDIRLKAAREIIERDLGKPVQPIGGADGVPLQFNVNVTKKYNGTNG